MFSDKAFLSEKEFWSNPRNSNPFPLASCSCTEATFAIVGDDGATGCGVISYHTNEFVARRANKENVKNGGTSEVIAIKDGDMKDVDNALDEILGRVIRKNR